MINVALVGLGDIGHHAHLPALLRNPDVSLAAVVDPVAERRALVDVPGFAELAPVLADESITAIVLATPPWVTTGLAAESLRAGKFVLAEKPIATSVSATGPLQAVDVSRLQVGLTYRHDPALERLREWITTGRLGTNLLCRAHIYDERRDPVDTEHTARILADLRYGPPVMHEGSHIFDWLSYLFGGPPTIADSWSLRTGDMTNINGARLHYPDGVLALTEFGWWTDRLPRCELSVLGDRGYAVLDGMTFRLTLQTAAGDEVVEFPGERMARCFDRQLARFVDLIAGRIDRAMPGFDEGLAALQVSESVATAGKEV